MSAIAAMVFAVSLVGGQVATGVVTPVQLATIVLDDARGPIQPPDVPIPPEHPSQKDAAKRGVKTTHRTPTVMLPRSLRELLPGLLQPKPAKSLVPLFTPDELARGKGVAPSRKAADAKAPAPAAKAARPGGSLDTLFAAPVQPGVGVEEAAPGDGLGKGKAWVPERTLPRVQPPLLTPYWSGGPRFGPF